MALDRLHYPYAIQLPSPVLTHLTSVTTDRGYAIHQVRSAAQAVPCFVGVNTVDPRLGFTTQQIKGVLDLLDIAVLAKDLSAGTATMWYRAGKSMDIRAADIDTVHVKAEMAESALLIWQTLTANQGEVAEIQCELQSAQRGASDPLVIVGSQALPGGIDKTCQEIYGMGPVKVNGAFLDGVTTWTWTNNEVMEPISSDGNKSVNYRGIREYHPQVTVNTHDLDAIAGLSYGGDELTTIELFLKRFQRTDVYYADNVAQHIKLTLHGGLRIGRTIDQSPAVGTLHFYGEDDGATLVEKATAVVIA